MAYLSPLVWNGSNIERLQNGDTVIAVAPSLSTSARTSADGSIPVDGLIYNTTTQGLEQKTGTNTYRSFGGAGGATATQLRQLKERLTIGV